MSKDLDTRPVAGIMFGLLLVTLLYFGIWWFITTDNTIIDWIDPQPHISEGVTHDQSGR